MRRIDERNRRQPMVLLLAVLFAVTAVGLGACDMMGASDFVGTSDDESGSARMQVLLVDGPFPFDLVDEVNVTISRVDIRDGRNTVTIMNDTRTFDLLELQNGVSAELGDIEIPAGTYKEARLAVEDAFVLMNDGRIFDVKVPSGSVKVKLHGVEVEDGKDVTLTLDFDVGKSFAVQGNARTPAGVKGFLLKPTVILKGMKENGRRGDDDGDDEENGDDDEEDNEDEEDEEDDERDITGIVTAIEVVEGSTFLTVEGLRIMLVSETEFSGFSDVDELSPGVSLVKIEYFEDSETGALIADEVVLLE